MPTRSVLPTYAIKASVGHIAKAIQMQILKSQIAMDNIKIEKLKSKFDSYVSYHVSVAVESNMVRDVSSTLMNCDIWPYGVLVRRFFNNRNG
jgi:hypothetical protein